MNKKNIMMFFAAVLCCSTAYAGGTKSLNPLKVDKAPKLDGKLNEAFWQKSEAVNDFKIWRGKGKKSEDTVLKTAYDNTWFYLGVKCKNKNIKWLQPKIKQHDGSVNKDDSLEIFIAPGTRARLYFHFILSFANVKAEQRITVKGGELVRKRDWNIPWQSAVSINDDGWSAEIAIPLYAFSSYNYGNFSNMKINVVRNKREAEVDSQNCIISEKSIHSVMAPVQSSFHEPKNFVKVSGMKPGPINVPFLVSFSDAVIMPYAIKKGKACYTVNFKLRAESNKSGTAIAEVVDTPLAGKANTVSKSIAISGNAIVDAEIDVPAESMSGRKVRLNIKDSVSGETIMSSPLNTDALDVVNAYSKLNYYTSEKSGTVCFDLKLPEESLKNMSAAVFYDAKKIGTSNKINKRSSILFLLDNIPAGKSIVTLDIYTKGKLFIRKDIELLKLPPQPNEIKIDKEHRLVLKNGKPFFTWGVVGYVARVDGDKYKQISSLGFESVLHWFPHTSTPEKAQGFMDVTAKAGLDMIFSLDHATSAVDFTKTFQGKVSPKELKAIVKLGKEAVHGVKIKGIYGNPVLRGLSDKIKNEICYQYAKINEPALIEIVKKIRSANNNIGYFIVDEPAPWQVKEGRAQYKMLKEHDPYRPVSVNYSPMIPDEDKFMDWCDIVMSDPYWIPAGDNYRNSPEFSARCAYTCLKRTERYRRPYYAMAMYSGYSGCRKRVALPEEQVCHTWLALIYGSRGIFYFGAHTMYPGMNKAFKDIINPRLKKLSPALAGVIPEQKVSYFKSVSKSRGAKAVTQAANCDPEKGIYPEVQIGLRKDPKGGYILLAANGKYYPVKTVFTVKNLSGKVKRVFSNTQVEQKGNAFSEKIEKFGTRTYKFDIKGEGPFEITVESKYCLADVPAREVMQPLSGRPGKKNIMFNPSFEEQSINGIPDYFWQMIMSGGNIDHQNALFGKNCIKLSNTRGYKQLYISILPERNTTYTYSVYMKGNKPGMKVGLFGFSGGLNPDKIVTISDKWQRYTLTGRLASVVRRSSYFGIRLLSKGELFIDGIQLEKGNNATEFED